MNIERKSKASNEISTSAMPDVIFILLIFFMVTTVMREYEGLPVIIPSAKMIEKLENKRNTIYIWVSKDNIVSVNDYKTYPRDLANVMYEKILSNPQLTVSLKSDENSSMELISEVHTQLRKANALKLNYSTKMEEE